MLIRFSLALVFAALPTFVFAIQFVPPLDEGIEFPETIVDETSTVEFTVSEADDVGPVTIRINGVQPNVFSFEPAQQVLRGGERVVFRISFTPDEAGEVEGRLTGGVFGADGNQQMAFATDLFGDGVNAENPRIEVSPRNISLEIAQRGDSDEATVEITNGGEGDLDFVVLVAEMGDWVEVEPREGHIDGNSDEMIQLRFSTTDVVPDSGVHVTAVLINTNDPENRVVVVDVLLLVSYQPVPVIAIDAETIELSITELDQQVQETFTIENSGERVLEYMIAVPEVAWIAVEPIAGEIEPDSSHEIVVSGFHSGLPNDEYQLEIFINSNDPENDEIPMNVRLVVNIADNIPIITLSTDSISLEIVEPEQQAVDTVLIGNSGHQPLALVLQIPDNQSWFYFELDSGLVYPDSSVEVVIFTTEQPLENGVYESRIDVISNDPDNGELAIEVNLVVDIQDIEEPSKSELPSSYRLSAPFPNPFNSETVISFALPRASDVSMKVYDLSGREIESILAGITQAGYHTLSWNAGELPTGIYLIKMETGEFRSVRKVMLIR